jgi:hypothetical protein
MGSAFVAIVPTRPGPLFGRPVQRRGSPHRVRPGASPHALRIPPRGGHPALLSRDGRGQRGLTPAFGEGAPHPSASGTSTHLSTWLPSAHDALLRLLRPPPPGLRHGLIPWVSVDVGHGRPEISLVPPFPVSAFRSPSAGEFFGAAFPESSPLPWPSPGVKGSALSCPVRVHITTLQDSLDVADC